MRGAKKTSVCMSEFVLRNHRRSDSVQHRRDAISAASLTHHPAPPMWRSISKRSGPNYAAGEEDVRGVR